MVMITPEAIEDILRCENCAAPIEDLLTQDGWVRCGECGHDFVIAVRLVRGIKRLAHQSRRPPQPSDMQVLVEGGDVLSDDEEDELRGIRLLAKRDAEDLKETDRMVLVRIIDKLRSRHARAPRISAEVLDGMRDGWTPRLVRELVADYRRLAGYDE